MDENNKELELMRRLIEQKKAKSASQGSIKKGPQDRFGTSSGKKRRSAQPVEESPEKQED